FLNVHDGIRRTFAAWTTPGDVLAEIMTWIETSRPDFSSLLLQYLQKELRRDQFAKLEQAGHLNDNPISLANVFLDLPVIDAPLDVDLNWSDIEVDIDDCPGFVEQLINEACVPIRQWTGGGDSDAGSARGRRDGRIVLLGGPGQGKTTVGQFVCQLFRARILTDCDATQIEAQVAEACHLIVHEVQIRDQSLPGCKRLPIRIVLSEFAADLAKDHQLSLLAYITSRLNVRAVNHVSPEDVANLLRGYPFILVLDGLDEVPASSNRDVLLEALADFEADIASYKMDAFILVTTRPQGYNEDLSPKYYQHRVLVPLDEELALRYGKKLTEVKYATDEDRIEKILKRLEYAASHEATSRLMQSPLQITIMTFLVDQYGHPPEDNAVKLET
ncbi:MAG: NACHT domain-containing protein, partial [Candidatus Binatia bacterium]